MKRDAFIISILLLIAVNLIDLYEAWNKPEDAEKWRVKLPKGKLWKSDTTSPQISLIFLSWRK